MAKNDGGPAYPVVVEDTGNRIEIERGLSIRDYFAGQAIIGLIIRGPFEQHDEPYCKAINGIDADVAVADDAYKVADAMLAERSRTDGK